MRHTFYYRINYRHTHIKKKLCLQIIFHGTDRASLHKHLYPACLPECYGGTLNVPRVSGPQWHELLLIVEKEYDGTAQAFRTIYDFFSYKFFVVAVFARTRHKYPSRFKFALEYAHFILQPFSRFING